MNKDKKDTAGLILKLILAIASALAAVFTEESQNTQEQ